MRILAMKSDYEILFICLNVSLSKIVYATINVLYIDNICPVPANQLHKNAELEKSDYESTDRNDKEIHIIVLHTTFCLQRNACVYAMNGSHV